jgi:hypothetical protein
MFTSMQRSDKPSIYKYSIHLPAGGSTRDRARRRASSIGFLYAPTARLLEIAQWLPSGERKAQAQRKLESAPSPGSL